MKTTLFLSAALLLAAAPLVAKDITFAQCPASVQGTVQANLNGAKVHEVDLATVNGLTLYVVELKIPGSKLERKLYLNENGELLKTRDDVALSELPAGIRQTAQDQAGPHGRIDDVERETADGKITYRVDIDREDKHGGDLKIVFSAAGAILSQSGD